MGAKDIILKPITAAEANAAVKRHHYSGKVVNNSQVHIGVFYQGKLEGAMQFGPSLDKRKLQPLVAGTEWNEFIELNRMAFSEKLPRNSESRAIAIAMKLLRKHAPHLKWVISFADGTQCGDGTIYRASGFVLTGVQKSTQIWKAPDGTIFSRMSLTDKKSEGQKTLARKKLGIAGSTGSAASMKEFVNAGLELVPGYQFRYIYFLDETARTRLTVPVIPFNAIPDECRMYRGKTTRPKQATSGDHPDGGGAAPTRTLLSPVKP